MWYWDEAAATRYAKIRDSVANPLNGVIMGLYLALGECGMLSYLSYLGERLIECHRVLKTTGSLYLHCDPTASHYLKLLLDSIFDQQRFVNEVIWYYKNASRGKRRLARSHDTIFWYSKTDNYHFDYRSILVPFESGMTKWRYTKGGQKGGVMPKGKTPDDVITLPSLNAMSKERTGYPTQKPRALLEQIIKASSKPNDVVLDPFCGCGTSIMAAQNLGRQWIGIDISAFAVDLVKSQLEKEYGGVVKTQGIPQDLQSARMLAESDRFAFESWAVMKIDQGFAPNTKQVGDGGIDGRGTLADKPENHDSKLAIAQIKSGNNLPKNDIRAFMETFNSHKAALGVFTVLNNSVITQGHRADFASVGNDLVFSGGSSYKRLQFWSIEDYFNDKHARIPPMVDPYRGERLNQMALV